MFTVATLAPIPLATVQPLLTALGFTLRHVPADWEDVGGPENGPELVGHNEFDVFEKGNMAVYVEGGFVRECEILPPDPEDFPF